MSDKFTFLIFSSAGKLETQIYFANSSNDALEKFHQEHFKDKPYLDDADNTYGIEKVVMIPGEQVDVSNKLRNKTKESLNPNKKRKHAASSEVCPVCYACPMTRSCPDKCEVEEDYGPYP